MVREEISQMILESLVDEIVRRVVEKIKNLPKEALIVLDKGEYGLQTALTSIAVLKQQGYTLTLCHGKDALGVEEAKKLLSPKDVILATTSNKKEFSKFDVVIAPNLTISSLSKIANNIDDTVECMVVLEAIMRNKKVILGIESFCPDNIERKAAGYGFTDSHRQVLVGNMERVRSYGAVLSASAKIANKIVKVETAEKPVKKVVTAPVQSEGLYVGKSVIGKSDVVLCTPGTTVTVNKNALVTQLALDEMKRLQLTLIRK